MSVFSLDVAAENPVGVQDLNEACSILGVVIKDHEKEDYTKLLAVYHESMTKLMAMEGQTRLLPPKASPRMGGQRYSPRQILGRLHSRSRH